MSQLPKNWVFPLIIQSQSEILINLFVSTLIVSQSYIFHSFIHSFILETETKMEPVYESN